MCVYVSLSRPLSLFMYMCIFIPLYLFVSLSYSSYRYLYYILVYMGIDLYLQIHLRPACLFIRSSASRNKTDTVSPFGPVPLLEMYTCVLRV